MEKYYYIKNVEAAPGDGNCMFYSIWNQLDSIYKTKIEDYVKKFDNFKHLQQEYYEYWKRDFMKATRNVNLDKEAGFIYLRILCHMLRDSNDIRRVKHLENAFAQLVNVNSSEVNSNNSTSQHSHPKSRWGDEYDLLYIANFLEQIRIILYQKWSTLGPNIYKLYHGIGFKHENAGFDDFDEIYLIYYPGRNDGHYNYTIEKPLEFEYDGKGDINDVIEHTQKSTKTRLEKIKKEEQTKMRKLEAQRAKTNARYPIKTLKSKIRGPKATSKIDPKVVPEVVPKVDPKVERERIQQKKLHPLEPLEQARHIGRQELDARVENRVKKFQEKKDKVEEEQVEPEQVEPEKNNSNNVGKAAMLLILLFGIATIY